MVLRDKGIVFFACFDLKPLLCPLTEAESGKYYRQYGNLWAFPAGSGEEMPDNMHRLNNVRVDEIFQFLSVGISEKTRMPRSNALE